MAQASSRDFFSKHAEAYAKSHSHAGGSDLSRLVELIRPKKSDVALDLATGTGFTAAEFAISVNQVIGVDITREMILEAIKIVRDRGIKNLQFALMDVAHLSFVGNSFDIVTTRRAAHHFANLPKMLEEASRVLKSNGKLGVVDMSPLKGSKEFFNRIERVRDSTHTIALPAEDWKDLVVVAGFRITHQEILGEELTFEQWLSPIKPGGWEEREVVAAFENASPEVKKLMKAREDSQGKIVGWTKPRIILVAEKK